MKRPGAATPCLAASKQLALYNQLYQVTKSGTSFPVLLQDEFNLRTVHWLQPSAESVFQQSGGECPCKLRLSVHEQRAKLTKAAKLISVHQGTRRVNLRTIAVLRQPAADRIEVLQGKPRRVNPPMAVVTGSHAAVFL